MPDATPIDPLVEPVVPGSLVTLDVLETEHIRLVMARIPRLTDAARVLGINPATLYRKRVRLGMIG